MKNEYSIGETIIAKLSGTFIDPPLRMDLNMYRGSVRIASDIYIAKINEDYYLSTQPPSRFPGNYSLVIENVKYKKGLDTSEENIVKNFTIKEGLADFSISPGFVNTKDDFAVQLTNLQDSKITVSISELNESAQTSETTQNGGFLSFLFGSDNTKKETSSETLIDIKSGETEKLTFNIGDITEPTFKTIVFKSGNTSYEIPVYIYANKTSEFKNFRFEPAEINLSRALNSSIPQIIFLYNSGDTDLYGITLEASNDLKPFVNLSVKEIDKLEKNSSIKIQVDINLSEAGIFEGEIKAKSLTNASLITYLPLTINVISDYIPPNNDTEAKKTCDSIGGSICEANETCSSENSTFLNGVNCCIGTCTSGGSSSLGKTVGWILLIGVGVFILWFYFKKYRGVGKANIFSFLSKK
jgi:hypothetical protein